MQGTRWLAIAALVTALFSRSVLAQHHDDHSPAKASEPPQKARPADTPPKGKTTERKPAQNLDAALSRIQQKILEVQKSPRRSSPAAAVHRPASPTATPVAVAVPARAPAFARIQLTWRVALTWPADLTR